MIESEQKREMAIDYGLEHLWLLTQAVFAIGGGELKTPRYIELSHPEVKFEDSRTADQIIDNVIDMFG